MPKNVMCKKCNNYRNQWCDMVIDSPDPDLVRDCQHFWMKTNADRIRAMTDEELAIFVRAVIMADGCPNGEVDCNECSVMEICNQSGLYEHEKEWLQQPAEGE